MEKEQKTCREPKKKTTNELIAEAAEKGAEKVLLLQRKTQSANHYRAMEDLLRAYPKRLRMMEHPEEFDFFPAGRSKDISIAPPPGCGVVDKIDVAEMFTEARKRAYEFEMFKLYQTEYAIVPFKHMTEYAIIRMIYFGEDVHGNYRGNDARPYSFNEIIEALHSIGIAWSERTVRHKRSKLVQAMTVMMFGTDGALSIETRDENRTHNKNDNKKGTGENGAAEMEDAEGQVCAEGR